VGVHENISFEKFPQQGKHLGKRVMVSFHYDISKISNGEVVRDDVEAPYETIIKLSDGRYVLGQECQYRLVE